jgi:hypothetical protein
MMTIRQSATGNRQSFAWHGWSLAVPREWNPVRIEGGWRSGFALFADLHKPRLGLRWGVVSGKRVDANVWTRSAIRDEIGVIAAREARAIPSDGGKFEASIVYPHPDPPGRDVWAGFSRATGRGVELIYHAQRRDSVLEGSIVPTLCDCAVDQPTPWSVFDLRCVAPAGMRLKSHQLSAGDLRLAFACATSGRFASVRQIAVAKLALSRMPLKKWLAGEVRARLMHYAASNESVDVRHETTDGRALCGVSRTLKRRRRSFFMRWLPPELVTAALHDAARDRLVLVQADSDERMRELLNTVGCAASG